MSLSKNQIKVIHYKEIDSTNREAVRLAKANGSEWTIVVADKQTAGRGRYQRNWESPAGLGLWFSIILRPQIELEHLNMINLVTALCIKKFIQEKIDDHFSNAQDNVRLKWPNDILVDGKKICGILLESSLRKKKLLNLVIGIGLNLNQTVNDFSDDLKTTATSLKILTGKVYLLKKILRDLLNKFYDDYHEALNNDFVDIIEQYQENMLYQNELVQLDLGDHTLQGYICGLNNLGYLLLDVGGEQKVISAGDLWRVNSGDSI